MKTLLRIKDALKTWFAGKAGLPSVLALMLGVLVVFAWPSSAQACGTFDIPCYIAAIFVKIFELLTALMGYILIMEVDALIRVAQYANFVSPGPTAVQIGWVVTRDLANMFFIVFLLIIAFSTIIGYEKYAYRSNLRRLLVMAVVINFSKTICGIFIDMSQVMMLTFVNGFKEAAAGNFLSAFQIQKLLDLAERSGDYTFGLVLAMMLAFVLAAIAACVVLVMLVMMTFRIVMLWILIILSPIAFLTSAFPLGTNYYAQWWGELKKYLTSGPITAFFLWLALACAQKNPDGLAKEEYKNKGGFAPQSTAAQAEAASSGTFQGYSIPSEAGKADTILSMVIEICILFAGLKFASESGAAGAGFAGQVKGKVQNTLKRIASAPVGAAGFAAGAAANRAKQAGFGVAGSLLASRVGSRIGLGGFGAAALAKEEEMKKSRRASIEKFTGSEDQKQKYMPPAAYSARVAGMKDPKLQMEALKSAASNPAIARELFKEKEGADGNKYSQGGLAAANILAKGKDKEFMEMTDLMSSDKNFAKEMKNGNNEDLIRGTRDRMQKIVGADGNQGKRAGAFDQKFVAQLAQMEELGADGKPTGKMILGDAELKKMMPNVPLDDIGTLDAGGLGVLTKHMSDAQFAKARESVAADPGKDNARLNAFKDATTKSVGVAMESGDESKIAEAVKRAIHSGAMGAEGLKDPKIRSIVGNRMDVGSLVRGMDRGSDGQRSAVTEVMRSVQEINPDRAKNMGKNDQLDEFMSPVLAQAKATADKKASDEEASVKKQAAQEAAAIEKKSADAAAATKAEAARSAAREEVAAASQAAAIHRQTFAEAQKSGDAASAKALQRSDSLDKSRGQGGAYEGRNREESSRLKGAVGSYSRAKKEASSAEAKRTEGIVNGKPSEWKKLEADAEAAQKKLISAAKALEDALKKG